MRYAGSVAANGVIASKSAAGLSTITKCFEIGTMVTFCAPVKGAA